jgi:hypothetical protein
MIRLPKKASENAICTQDEGKSQISDELVLSGIFNS